MQDRDFPEFIAANVCFRDAGTRIYSTPLTEWAGPDLFYTAGHPCVGSAKYARYQLVEVIEVQCDRSPEAKATWKERHGR